MFYLPAHTSIPFPADMDKGIASGHPLTAALTSKGSNSEIFHITLYYISYVKRKSTSKYKCTYKLYAVMEENCSIVNKKKKKTK